MKINEMQAGLDAVSDKLDGISAQLAKAQTEIVAEIQTLKDAAANADVPTAVTESLDRLTGKVGALQPIAQALDDLNPDPAPPAAN